MSNTILINLQESDQAKDYKDENLVHATEFEIISKHFKTLAKIARDEPFKDNLHNAITVWGTRGSGKTSFLLSIHEYIQENLKNLELLPIVDPTLIEEKGHVFLNVISAISAQVEKKLKGEECQPHTKPYHTRREWRENLLKLAAGIPSIDGVGSINMETWQDAEFIMDSGLIAVKAARELKDNFNSILKIALGILKKHAIVITFDDIDVDSTKGWAILECIRKYFTSSRLIVIVSGDPNLYLSVIRQKKWTNFGAELIKYEGTHWRQPDGTNDRLISFNDMITDLTAQYMLKIMPPKHRIHLTTLQEKLNYRSNLNIKIVQGEKQTSIQSLYNSILEKFGFSNKLQLEVYRTFLLSLPLRTQIQFLLTMQSFADITPVKPKTVEKKADETNEGDADKEAEQAIVKANVTDIFLADLQEKNVDTLIAGNVPKFLNAVILKLLVKEKRLNDLYQLQPVTTDRSLNASLFSLNIQLAETILNQYKFIVFDYFIRIALLRNIAGVISYERKVKEKRSDLYIPTIEDLCNKTGLYNDIVLRDLVVSIHGYVCGALDLGNDPLNEYFIRLNGLKGKAKRPLLDRLDSVFAMKEITETQRTLGHIPGFSLFYRRNASIVCYSTYVLIATIGEIVKRHELLRNEKQSEERKREIEIALNSLAQLRAYPVIEFANTIDPTKQNRAIEKIPTESEELEEENDQMEDDISTASESTSNKEGTKTEKKASDIASEKQLAEWLFDWMNTDDLNDTHAKKIFIAAPHLLGKIFTRFYSTVKNIMERRTKLELGDLIHFQIVAFLNAVIIEESLERLNNEPNLNVSNTNLSSLILRQNLKKLNDFDAVKVEKMALSKWLLSCPLLMPYIDKSESELIERLAKFAGSKIKEYNKLSITSLLNSVSIFGRSEENSNSIKSSEYPRYPVSESNKRLIRKGNELELIKELVNGGYPKEWFITIDSTTDYRHNIEIRKYLSSIFGDKNHTSIRNFRKFLTANQELWK